MTRLLLASLTLLALGACSQDAAPPATPAASTPTPVAAADQPAQVTPPASANDLFATKLDEALGGAWRSDANKTRDAWRHPKETLTFFGIAPGQTVVEITPGGGWYTEILAPWLKDSGTYVAAIAAPTSSDYAKRGAEAYRTKLAGDADRYGQVQVVEFDPAAPALGPAGSADVVLTFRNVHNWRDNAPAMFKAFFDVLKAGGTLGVVDHRAAVGTDLDADRQSGYLPQDYVIRLATEAGFQLAAQSEINANPKDTKDYEKGVWTLPPTLTLGDTDREKYQAIGESDRMTLKFVKPAQ